ncbi:hypothetical protein BLNAU_10463 [Blattamonas nauphoetae]|uniref:Uncharacterized protein n=1 Tax=Blattamonas nauphoetae TaxID=2049346 RepID=A0ABQ9XSY4_9EUKA|nr:hypothetical protein BLNAU_10463 [Blattamonas nauphoetae]
MTHFSLFDLPEDIDCPICSNSTPTSSYLDHFENACLESLPDTCDPSFMKSISQTLSCPLCERMNIHRPCNIFDFGTHLRTHISISNCEKASELSDLLSTLHPTFDTPLKLWIESNINLKNDRTFRKCKTKFMKSKPNGFVTFFQKLFVRTPPKEQLALNDTTDVQEDITKPIDNINDSPKDNVGDFQLLNIPQRLKNTHEDNEFPVDLLYQSVADLFSENSNVVESNAESSQKCVDKSSIDHTETLKQQEIVDFSDETHDTAFPSDKSILETESQPVSDTHVRFFQNTIPTPPPVFHPPNEVYVPIPILLKKPVRDLPLSSDTSSLTNEPMSA